MYQSLWSNRSLSALSCFFISQKKPKHNIRLRVLKYGPIYNTLKKGVGKLTDFFEIKYPQCYAIIVFF